MKKNNFSLTLIFCFIFILSCTPDNKENIEILIFHVENRTDKDIEIFVKNNINPSYTIPPFSSIIDSSTTFRNLDNHLYPDYITRDSTQIIFNQIKFIKYFVGSNFANGYSLVNNKNLMIQSTWESQNLSEKNKKIIKFTFYITEEDYALAEDL
jgi:hypothetical protein